MLAPLGVGVTAHDVIGDAQAEGVALNPGVEKIGDIDIATADAVLRAHDTETAGEEVAVGGKIERVLFIDGDVSDPAVEGVPDVEGFGTVFGGIAAHVFVGDAEGERISLDEGSKARSDICEAIVDAVVRAQDLEAATVSGLGGTAIVASAAGVTRLGGTTVVAGAAGVTGVTGTDV